jgi:hypothetical protein
MKLTFAISWLRTAKRHVEDNSVYRWWPLYSACLATLLYTTAIWPFDLDQLYVYYDLPWLYDLEWTSWDCGLALALCLGLVGLLRRSWISRLLSLYGVWMTSKFVYWQSWLESLWVNFTWYAFDIPNRWIVSVAGEGTSAATMLWCVYLFVLWVAFRPLLKRACANVNWLAETAIHRWPQLERLAKPVM